MRNGIMLLPCLLLAGCVSQAPLLKATASGNPEATFTQATAKQIRDELAGTCAQSGGILETSEYTITCSKQNDSMRGMFAQAMLGNACSHTPMERIQFTTTQRGDDVFVTARAWMEIDKCFGEKELVPYDNNNFRNEVQTGLDGAVARWNAKRPTLPVATPAPQHRELDPAKRCDACQDLTDHL